ncbi:hypothetical protein [Oscillibacter sp.]|uniref:hypothetical protein n=1 Tax=Oscillibacter sp. TaxID=1945593 RepID=UPI00289F7A09|nr:hypothetical protein [Oscillibacter sp.]
MKKKFMSLALAVVMCMSLCVPAFAAEYRSSLTYSNASVQADEVNVGNDINLVIEDYPNGDAKISQIVKGVTTCVSYVHRAEHYIEDISYEQGNPISSIKYFFEEGDSARASLRASYTTAGTITYQYYDTIPVTRYLTCAYQKTSESNMYNLTGKYKNIASLVGLITGVLSIPGLIAGEVAAKVVLWLGIGDSIGGFFIPDYWVTCNDICVNWKLTDGGGYSTNMSGHKYVLTDDKHNGDSEYSGDYYETNSYSRHDTAFALRAYEIAYYTRDTVTIFWG